MSTAISRTNDASSSTFQLMAFSKANMESIGHRVAGTSKTAFSSKPINVTPTYNSNGKIELSVTSNNTARGFDRVV